jgi:TetR/AcrR family transcriptional regulator, regulator of autoinduction and epiphytic fitness
MSSPSPDVGPVVTDGRVARGIRARESIAEAMIALFEEGVVRPTAKQVAERAGVSIRLVFHHFEDMEALLESAVAIQADRHWRRPEVPARGDLHTRVRAIVRWRAELFEAIAPVRRASNLTGYDSPVLAHYLETARRVLRNQTKSIFAEELDSEQIRGRPARRREMLDALEVAASFESWDHLRRELCRPKDQARRVLERLMIGVLEQGDP